jgi:hypothetical protein
MGKPERIAEVLARVAGEAPESKYFRAYHGSPYDFDRFDASKIGTGEGAQSFGFGHYFAGREGVSQSYRDKLSPDRDVLIGGIPSVEYLQKLRAQGKSGTSPEWMAVSALREYAPEAVDVEDLFSSAVGYWPEDTKIWLDALDNLRRKDVALGPRHGRMYEVEVGHPEESLIDYDAPIGQQPKTIRENSALLEMSADEARNNALQATTQGRHDHWMNIAKEPTQAPASLAIQAGRNRRPIGAGRPPMSAREWSDYLFQSGVPGIRYLDQGSRAAGDGTRNYVMFPGTEDSIRILRKYAVPGAIGAGAMQDQPQSRPSPSY